MGSTLPQYTALQRAAFARSGVRQIVEEKRSSEEPSQPSDALVVYEMARPARILSGLLRILRVTRNAEAAFRSLTEPMETETPAGELLLHLLCAFAQFECAMIRERCIAGRAAARERGVRFSRPPVLSGDLIRKLRDDGLNWSEIAKHVGAAVSTVRRAGFSRA